MMREQGSSRGCCFSMPIAWNNHSHLAVRGGLRTARTASPYLHGNPLEFKAPYVGSSVGEFDQASDKVCDKVYGRRHLVEKFQAVKKPTDRIGDWLRHRKIACGAWA